VPMVSKVLRDNPRIYLLQFHLISYSVNLWSRVSYLKGGCGGYLAKGKSFWIIANALFCASDDIWAGSSTSCHCLPSDTWA
jgi:hypothetical protein